MDTTAPTETEQSNHDTQTPTDNKRREEKDVLDILEELTSPKELFQNPCDGLLECLWRNERFYSYSYYFLFLLNAVISVFLIIVLYDRLVWKQVEQWTMRPQPRTSGNIRFSFASSSEVCAELTRDISATEHDIKVLGTYMLFCQFMAEPHTAGMGAQITALFADANEGTCTKTRGYAVADDDLKPFYKALKRKPMFEHMGPHSIAFTNSYRTINWLLKDMDRTKRERIMTLVNSTFYRADFKFPITKQIFKALELNQMDTLLYSKNISTKTLFNKYGWSLTEGQLFSPLNGSMKLMEKALQDGRLKIPSKVGNYCREGVMDAVLDDVMKDNDEFLVFLRDMMDMKMDYAERNNTFVEYLYQKMICQTFQKEYVDFSGTPVTFRGMDYLVCSHDNEINKESSIMVGVEAFLKGWEEHWSLWKDSQTNPLFYVHMFKSIELALKHATVVSSNKFISSNKKIRKSQLKYMAKYYQKEKDYTSGFDEDEQYQRVEPKAKFDASFFTITDHYKEQSLAVTMNMGTSFGSTEETKGGILLNNLMSTLGRQFPYVGDHHIDTHQSVVMARKQILMNYAGPGGFVDRSLDFVRSISSVIHAIFSDFDENPDFKTIISTPLFVPLLNGDVYREDGLSFKALREALSKSNISAKLAISQKKLLDVAAIIYEEKAMILNSQGTHHIHPIGI